MLPGPNEIIKCTNCDCLYVKRTLLSGNTFGGVSFSDGSAFYPMMPQFPKLISCSECDTLFWVKDAPLIGTCEWEDDICEDWQNAMELTFPLIEEYLLAIEQKIYKSIDEEVYIRIQIWWILNGLRNKGQLTQDENFLYIENSLRLLELVKPNIPDNILIIAELYRNLGRFDEAKEMVLQLNDNFPSDIKQKFLKHIKNKNTKTFKL